MKKPILERESSGGGQYQKKAILERESSGGGQQSSVNHDGSTSSGRRRHSEQRKSEGRHRIKLKDEEESPRDRKEKRLSSGIF
jgi:hypothetical protein